MDSTPEEKIKMKEFMEWAKNQPWNQEEDTTNE